MGFEKGDNCEVCQLGKAGSTSVGGSTPTWWLPICCPCNKTTSLEPGFIDRYGKEIGIIIFFFEAQQQIVWHLATGQPMWNILVSYCSSDRTLKKFLFIFFWPLLHFLYLKTVIHNKAEPLCGKTEMLSPGKTVRPKKTFHQNIFCLSLQIWWNVMHCETSGFHICQICEEGGQSSSTWWFRIRHFLKQ